MYLFTLIATAVNAIPDPVRFAIMPVLKVLAHVLNVPLFEDGTLNY